MSTMRAHTREFRRSGVGLVLSKGLSIRRAADGLDRASRALEDYVRDGPGCGDTEELGVELAVTRGA
jgi:hypothetical protein